MFITHIGIVLLDLLWLGIKQLVFRRPSRLSLGLWYNHYCWCNCVIACINSASLQEQRVVCATFDAFCCSARGGGGFVDGVGRDQWVPFDTLREVNIHIALQRRKQTAQKIETLNLCAMKSWTVQLYNIQSKH